jgi:hypothetical protein
LVRHGLLQAVVSAVAQAVTLVTKQKAATNDGSGVLQSSFNHQMHSGRGSLDAYIETKAYEKLSTAYMDHPAFVYAGELIESWDSLGSAQAAAQGRRI